MKVENMNKNNRGITLIALIVTVIILIIIAGMSISSLIGKNSIFKQTDSARVTQIEGTVREQVKLGCSLMQMDIEEERIYDRDYSAKSDAENIKNSLENTLNSDKEGLSGQFKTEVSDSTITIIYVGNDYKNACNDDNAEIKFTVKLEDVSIEIAGEENQSDSSVNIGGGTGDDTGDLSKKLSGVAQIGQYVNYDPVTGGNVTTENTKYTSIPGSTTEHGNGYTTDTDGQTFSAQAYKNSGGKWQILDIDENGVITLISDLIYQDKVDEDGNTIMGEEGLYIYNALGYIWAEEELHRIASIYGHGKGANTSKTVTYYYGGPNDQDLEATGKFALTGVEAQQGRKAILSLDTPSGARALTADDVNKICGKDTTYKTDYYHESPVTKNSDNATYYPTINTTNTTTGQSAEQSIFSGSYYSTDIYYDVLSTNSDSNVQEIQKSMLTKSQVNYWLASRYVSAVESSANFFVSCMFSNGYISSAELFKCSSSGLKDRTMQLAVRTIVTLESGIKTSNTSYPGDTTGWNLAD